MLAEDLIPRLFAMASGGSGAAAFWDQRYRDGNDGWELGRPAPPLQRFLQADRRAPQPPGLVLVPGCGRGHEAALLAAGGFQAVGLDFSEEALAEARRLHGDSGAQLRWLQADLLDRQALEAQGLGAGSLNGVLEHTCFCAIDPAQRDAYLAQLHHLLKPNGWLLGLFWCHRRQGGPPYGRDPQQLHQQLSGAGFVPELWEPAQGSLQSREDEWLALWRRAP
jgi:thiopurine S-methyltransferase